MKSLSPTAYRPAQNYSSPELEFCSRSKQTIVICDNNLVLAEGLSLILQADSLLSTFQISFRTPDYFASEMKLAPSILIVNPWHVDTSREAAMGHFSKIPDGTSVIGYCSEATLHEVNLLISLGFKGFFPTNVPSDQLVRIVSAVAFGGVYISDFYHRNETSSAKTAPSVLPSPDVLTEREIDVLQRLALGNSMKEVAAALEISTKTVDTYKIRANRKLNLRTRADIVRYAIDSGWLA
jgi:DNA-binding NarL/FixJ family response regulator